MITSSIPSELILKIQRTWNTRKETSLNKNTDKGKASNDE